MKWREIFAKGGRRTSVTRTESLRDMTEEEFARTVAHLDALCTRVTNGESASHSIAPPSVVDIHHTNGRNRFYSKIEHLSDAQVERQLLFQSAFLDLHRIFTTQVKLRFFLACGTALGAHREGYFIAHDDDIDVGVYVSDIALVGAATQAEEQRASNGVLHLLSSLTAEGLFVPFDICGEVEKGLEIRLLHVATQVKVDINVYYPPVEGGDDAYVAQNGTFVWSGTHYEDSLKRKYGMYRFSHKSLTSPDKDLVKTRFCCEADDGPLSFVLGPTERYLVEYFGEDWKQPKPYTYAEGVRGEFKNLIDE
ncbi:hypothetical protein AGDE_08697 [Angomonas deanei]|uniref:LicD family, putative n=1 Tax=Angomonas deanei TaxID=59799 RepID=A0A7G2CBJ9_9TRYP|nr:hypothetical protein AGDE_08697 [Angomonas deanei]CAD2216304.1 LicD family, putative [Angomonas deanei]|eukprot:EPY32429.1 hypothetical protein AGDE_08697 [Angomonas deanei]